MTDTARTLDLLTRREALRRVSALLGGAALVGQSAWLTGCETTRWVRSESGELFTSFEVGLLDEVADTILPPTSTPGAKAAQIGAFIATMVTDTYDARQQRIFRDGLVTLQRECRAQHGTEFMAASAAERLALLERLDREQFEYRARPGQPHYFRMIKELTLLGYFTSEIGYTQAMRYIESPGRFDPCVTYTPGEKAWAPHA
jgi:hypothetical protein